MQNIYKQIIASKCSSVVLKINSPGGTEIAAYTVLKIIEKLKEQNIKVYAVMGRVAASGGYLISVAANKIYAHPMTITGSIGTLLPLPKAKNY